MKNYYTYILISILLFNVTLLNSAAVKSKKQSESSKATSIKNIVSGKIGLLSESKTALISETSLKTQNYSNDNSVDFSKFKKITLKTVILETLSLNNTLKAAKEKLVQAKIALDQSSSGYLPTVDFQLDTKVSKKFGIIDTTDDKRDTKIINDQRYKISINQPIYSGGTTALKIKSIEAKYQEAKFKYEIVLNQTIQKAIKAYFQLLFSMQKIEVNTQNMNKLTKILSISQVKFESGAISTGDLSAIKAGVANAQTQLNNIQSELSDGIDFYLYLLSDKFQKTKPYEKNFTIDIANYEELKNEIIEKNLILQNYRLNILGTKYKLKSFKNNLKPKIDLQMKMSHILNQEDFVDDAEEYSAKLIFRYNIFNKGKDVSKIITTYSSIEELQYRYQEEIKKISWDTSKLYNSLKALSLSLKSVRDEIKSTTNMTDVYWEGFQLGEQDLQVLLQGEKQLNSAQLSLLKFKQDYLTNMFKVLNKTNKLASFFDIDPYSTYYIDYTNVDQVDTNIDMQYSLDNENADLNNTIDSYLETIHEYTFNDIVNFKDDFLQANDDEYTIVISDFENAYKAYDYIKDNRLYTNSFSYDFLTDNASLNKITLDKIIKIRTNIAHGIYKNEDEANTALNNLFDTSKKQFKVKKIKYIKDIYSNYVDGIQANVNPYVIKPIPKKVFKTNPEFKKAFMNANKEHFSINVVSLSSMKEAEKLLKNEKITNESFVFKYGRSGEWIKVMYGIYPTYSQALEALNSKKNMMNKYHPIIEKISKKQALFKEYENFNKIIKLKSRLEKPNKGEIKTQSRLLRKKSDPKPKKEILKKKKPKDTTNNKKVTKDLNKKLAKKLIDSSLKPKKETLNTKKNNLERNKDLALNNINNKVTNNNKTNNNMQVGIQASTPTLPFKITVPKTKKITFKKPKSYKNDFEKAFFNSPKGSYSIILGTLKLKAVSTFIKKYVLDEKYIVSKYNKKYRVIYGIYKNKKLAIAQKKNLHPRIINNAEVVLIESVK